MSCDITYTVPYANHDFSSHNFMLCIMWSNEHLWMHYMKGYEDKNTWSDYCSPISFIDLVKSVYQPLIHAVGGQHTILLAPCASHLGHKNLLLKKMGFESYPGQTFFSLSL